MVVLSNLYCCQPACGSYLITEYLLQKPGNFICSQPVIQTLQVLPDSTIPAVAKTAFQLLNELKFALLFYLPLNF